MKRLAIYTAIAWVIGFAATAAAADREYGSAAVERVTSVYDGDTFRADIAGWPAIIGERVPIRLAGADTPEIRASCDREKKLAREAKQFTVERLRSAKTITLERMQRGKYFRIVANVIADGRDLGQALIAAGLARPYEGGSREGWCG